MRIIRTLDFDEAYAEAPDAVQRSADRGLEFLARDFRHPSLRAKPWPEDGPDCYYARLTHGWRFYYQRRGDDAVVYWM
jgi:hypothetical protein